MEEDCGCSSRIKVVGAGGAGGNAIDRMISAPLEGVDFIAVNTDVQALDRCRAHVRVAIGQRLTGGLSAGGNWERGREAAQECRARLAELVEGAEVVFIAAGMGGGTGTGAAGVIAEVARSEGALTIGVVTRPFRWEGRVRSDTAAAGIQRMRQSADALIVIPNDRLTQVLTSKTTLEEAFRSADDVLRQGVQGITDLIVRPGAINLDLADIRAVMAGAGEALMGLGLGAGESRAEDAARQAVASPLLESSIDGAQAILLNITAGPDLDLRECETAADIVRNAVDPDANVIFGAVMDPGMYGEMRITLVATGLRPRS